MQNQQNLVIYPNNNLAWSPCKETIFSRSKSKSGLIGCKSMRCHVKFGLEELRCEKFCFFKFDLSENVDKMTVQCRPRAAAL